MIVHLADALRDGFHKIMLRSSDTDVVVLAVAAVARMNVQELWIAFGTGKNFRYIPIHEIVASIGPNKSEALPMLLTLGVTRFHRLPLKGRRPHGIHGSHMLKSLELSLLSLLSQMK